MYSDARYAFAKEQHRNVASQQKGNAKSNCWESNQRGLKDERFKEMLRQRSA